MLNHSASPPQLDFPDDSDPQKHLLEAEARLRESIAKLHRTQPKTTASSSYPPCHHSPDESCIAHAIGNLCQSFLLSYGVRVGIGVLLRAFKLARGRAYASLLDLKQLVSERDLIVREEACRIGLLFGGFTGSYHAIRCLLRKLKRKDTPLHTILAGSVAGLSVLALDDSNRRRTLALYLLTRVAQCAYNSAKSKKKFRQLETYHKHGDTLLFSLACAQVMYGFVMRPESLPKSYYDFILKTGPFNEQVYRAVRESCRGKTEEIVPCSFIHPQTSSCLTHNFRVTSKTFRKIFPLYFSLTFVPYVFLHLSKFMSSPTRYSLNSVRDAVRSSAFLSTFVGVFQGFICLHRKTAVKDHKFVYWIGGCVAALSVLLEKKSKRSELALYVLPRAGESLWYILVNRRFLPRIRNAEVALFCACMGGVMYYLEYESDTMSPFLRGLIRRFLASRINHPGSTMDPSASYNCLQSLDAVKKPHLSENGEREALIRKYDLDSIPGL